MSGSLRVLLVGPLPPPAGGMANQTRQLQRLLEAEGFDVSLVPTNAPYRPAWVAGFRGLRAVARLAPYLRNLWTHAAGVDVVHVMANSGLAWFLFAAPAIEVAKRRGTPVIVNYRGGLAAEFLGRSATRVRRSLLGTRVVVPSSFLREVFAGHGIATEVIPNVVDTDVFHPAPGNESRPAGAGPHVVIARNLEPIYGIDLGLRSIALLRDRWSGIRASIAGGGPEQARLEALARELGLEDCVRFTGRLDASGMVHLYHHADVVLNPVRADNAPNSLLEALACGVPVVSTRVGGVPHLVEHERTAILVDPESPAALASGVDRVLDDAQLRRDLIERGLELARGCSWPAVRGRWVACYDACAGRH